VERLRALSLDGEPERKIAQMEIRTTFGTYRAARHVRRCLCAAGRAFGETSENWLDDNRVAKPTAGACAVRNPALDKPESQAQDSPT
jgi:hypothetical protein